MKIKPHLLLSRSRCVKFTYICLPVHWFHYTCKHKAVYSTLTYSYSLVCGDFAFTVLTFVMSFVLTDKDECESNPCPDGSVCMDHIDGYQCKCLPDSKPGCENTAAREYPFK